MVVDRENPHPLIPGCAMIRCATKAVEQQDCQSGDGESAHIVLASDDGQDEHRKDHL